VKLLTAKEVAERLSVSSLTVIRLARAGAIPAVEIAKRETRTLFRFREESIAKFIASRERRGRSHERDSK
jgi:excisionase family DNA binding protein